MIECYGHGERNRKRESNIHEAFWNTLTNNLCRRDIFITINVINLQNTDCYQRKRQWTTSLDKVLILVPAPLFSKSWAVHQKQQNLLLRKCLLVSLNHRHHANLWPARQTKKKSYHTVTLFSFQAKQTSKSTRTKASRTGEEPPHSINCWPCSDTWTTKAWERLSSRRKHIN